MRTGRPPKLCRFDIALATIERQTGCAYNTWPALGVERRRALHDQLTRESYRLAREANDWPYAPLRELRPERRDPAAPAVQLRRRGREAA
jgi:hypothetical protein